MESEQLDTVVNNKYDTIKLERVASGEGEKVGDAESHQYSHVKKKKKKKKVPMQKKSKSAAEGDSAKVTEYNKLVHSSDANAKTAFDKDSYSVLDKPKNETDDDTIHKTKELPQIPILPTSVPGATPDTEHSIPMVEAYEDVPLVHEEGKKHHANSDPVSTEVVYYNEAAVAVSKIVDAVESHHNNQGENKRVNIYTQSISLENF